MHFEFWFLYHDKSVWSWKSMRCGLPATQKLATTFQTPTSSCLSQNLWQLLADPHSTKLPNQVSAFCSVLTKGPGRWLVTGHLQSEQFRWRSQHRNWDHDWTIYIHPLKSPSAKSPETWQRPFCLNSQAPRPSPAVHDFCWNTMVSMSKWRMPPAKMSKQKHPETMSGWYVRLVITPRNPPNWMMWLRMHLLKSAMPKSERLSTWQNLPATVLRPNTGESFISLIRLQLW